MEMTRVGPVPPEAEEAVPPVLGRVCIVVHNSIYGSISAGLAQYQADLALEGYDTTVYIYSSGDATAVKTVLAGLYAEPASLVGAVLIGNIPYIIYEMMQDWDGGGGDPPEYEDFPCDLYYMDFDGTWSDTLSDGEVQPGNGKYDTWTGDPYLEIWVCRMKTGNLGGAGSETGLLNSYLARNHAYRWGISTVGTTALVYDDDDWWDMAEEDADNVAHVYRSEDVTAVFLPYETTADDYKNNRLTTDYQLTLVRSHGTAGSHGFYRNDRTVFEDIYSWDYRTIDPGIEFTSLYVCSGSDHTVPDNLAGTIVFNPEAHGLLVWGSTKTGGMWSDGRFYARLAIGDIFGDAFVQWYNYVMPFHDPETVARWWYGMLMIGDATLRPFPDGWRPRAYSPVTGVEDSEWILYR